MSPTEQSDLFAPEPAERTSPTRRKGKAAVEPPLKWHGGKHYLAERIVAMMSPHLHYVEPFFGSGQVLFRRDPYDRRLWWKGKTSDGRQPAGVSEVVNDLDGH